MKRAAAIVSCVALAATIGAPLFFVLDRITLDETKNWMLAATILWFATAPAWVRR